jgi:hypothetical protein
MKDGIDLCDSSLAFIYTGGYESLILQYRLVTSLVTHLGIWSDLGRMGR